MRSLLFPACIALTLAVGLVRSASSAERASFPNSDASPVRLAFQEAAAKALGR